MPDNGPYHLRLRPHHLLCMLTYVGKGYSDNFVANFDKVIDKLNSITANIEVISGPDDICAPRLCDTNDTSCHCHEQHILEADKNALRDLTQTPYLQGVAVGATVPVTKHLIATLRHDYKSGKIRNACAGCEWFDLCTDIAQSDFKGTKLR